MNIKTKFGSILTAVQEIVSGSKLKNHRLVIAPYGVILDMWYGDWRTNVDELESEYPAVDFANKLNGMENVTLTVERSDGMAWVVTLIGEKDGVPHEAVHISWAILNMVGVKIDASNHEAQAYLVGYVVDKIYSLI